MRNLAPAILLIFGCSGGTDPGRNPGPDPGGTGGSGGRGGSTGAIPSGTGGSGGGSAGTGGASGGGGSASPDARSAGPDGRAAAPDTAARGDAAGAPDSAPAAPTRAFVYVGGDFGGSRMTVYDFDLETGNLTQKSTLAAGSAPTYLLLHPNGRVLYVTNEVTAGRVFAFAINPADGSLTPINDQPSAGAEPAQISIHKSGKYLLASNYANGRVAALPLGPDGALGPPIDPQNAGPNAHMILDDGQSANFVFVPCADGPYIAQYRFDASTGRLQPNSPPTVATRARPRHMVFHPSGRFAYVTHERGDPITAFRYDPATGLLSQPTNVPGPANGAHIMIHANGQFVYLLGRGDNNLQVDRISSDGALTSASQVSGLSTPWDFTVTRDWSHLLVVNSGSRSVRSFAVDPTTGALSARGTAATTEAPHGVVVAVF
jgi:6-phosphogluconolactonase